MKGITPVIAIILLLLIVIAVAGFTAVFLQDTVAGTSETVEQAANTQTSTKTQFVEFVASGENTITIKNVGTSVIDGSKILIQLAGTPVTITNFPITIQPGQSGTFTLDSSELEDAPTLGKISIIAPGNTIEADDIGLSTSSIAGYWEFDGSVADSSNNGNDGQIIGNPQFVTGQYGQALSFDGDEYVDVSHDISLNLPSLLISAMVKSGVDASGLNDIIISKIDGKKGYQLGLTEDNRPYASFEDISVNTFNKFDNTIITTPSNDISTNGRIPLGTNGRGDVDHVLVGSVIKDGDTYKMWYSGRDNSKWRIYYATSPDGLTWTKYNNVVPESSDAISTDGRLAEGSSGGDVGGVTTPHVIKDGSTYKMWYSGHDNSIWRIYYATSPDGLTWEKYNNDIPDPSDTISTDGRIPLGTTGKGDDTSLHKPVVIKDGDTYKMWYGGNNDSAWRIYYATSPDGLTWEKYNNDILDPSDTISTDGRIPLGTTGKGDDIHAYQPIVIKDGNIYRMWYAGYDSSNARIYYATSPDGLTWTKYDNDIITTPSNDISTNGRIPLGTNGRGDDMNTHRSAVIKEGSLYRIWYSGYDGSRWRVYYASMETGVTSNTQLSSGWSHVIGSLNSGNIEIKINGNTDSSTTTSVTDIANTENLVIGDSFVGELDEVRVMDTS